MLTLLFVILLIGLFGRFLFWGIRAAWSVGTFLLILVFLPVILIGMVILGFLYYVLPLLIIIGVITMVVDFSRRH